MSVERREGPRRAYEKAYEKYKEAQAKAPEAEETKALEAAVANVKKRARDHEIELAALRRAQRYPSRVAPDRGTSVSELEDLAKASHSLWVHPTQLYSAVNAMLLSGFLAALFHVRKRHGVVIAALFVCYPIARFLLELIRTDNPHDTVGLTISQGISLGMVLIGIGWLVYLYKYCPERSPYADAARPPKEAA
jgi:prolipoprotein diacylglyceryltransferase